MATYPITSIKIELNDGNSMPMFGLGCYNMTTKAEVTDAIASAVSAGYRLFDTATMYGNEEWVGQALKSTGLDRKDYFLVTKLNHPDHGYDETLKAISNSLNLLEHEYIDLYLIHGPAAGKNTESWKAILEMKKRGFIKSAGVSNFNIHHLQALMDLNLEMPVVNQIENHPWLQQREVVDFCRTHNIAVMGYCPLARMYASADGKEPKLDEISQRLQVSKTQVLLRWGWQHNLILIPKSSKPQRIMENANIQFELSDKDMKTLDSFERNLRVSCPSILSPWIG